MARNCIDQISLEKYILTEFKRSVDPSIPEHLQECPFCARRYEELKRFYENFQSILAFSSPPFPKHVRIKRINSYTMKLKQLAGDDDSKRAAAHSKNGPFNELVAVYTAEDENILLRLFKNSESSEYQLSLVSEDPMLYEFVIVDLDGIDGNFVSDANGTVFLGKIKVRDLTHLIFRIHTPDLVYVLNSREVAYTLAKEPDPQQITLKKAIEGRYDIQVKKQAERYDLDFQRREGGENQHHMVIGSEDKKMYRPTYLTESSFGFTRIPLKKDFTLRLYYAGSQI